MSDMPELAEMLKAFPPPIADGEEHLEIGLPDAPDEPTLLVAHNEARMFPASEGLSIPPSAGAWSRFFARQIDLLVFGTVAAVVLYAIFPGLSHAEILDNTLVSSIVFIPPALIIDAVVLAALGSTLGKLIFGIRVRQIDASKLNFRDALRRNLTLWVSGLAFGIPLVSLITLWKSYREVVNGRRCSWDENPVLVVSQAGVGYLRKSFGIAAFFALVIGLNALGVVLSEHVSATNKVAQVAPQLPAIQWMNPLTNKSVTLFAGWKRDQDDVKDKPDVFMFTNRKDYVILGREAYSEGDFGDYLNLLMTGAKFGTLDDKKVQIDASGKQYFLLTFHDVVANQPVREDVKVWQGEPKIYWRSIAISPLDDATERAEANALADTLAQSTASQ